MSSSYHQLYVHLVWATFKRLPLITLAVEPQLHSVISAKVESLGCATLAVGGIEDHVHLVARFPPTAAISDLAKAAKGASSHFMNHVATPQMRFQWQEGYGAFTFSKLSIDDVVAYVRNQKTRHASRKLIADFEIDEPGAT